MSADLILCKVHKFTIKMKDGRKLCKECLISEDMHKQHKQAEKGENMKTKTEVKHTPTPWHLRNESTEIAYSDDELVSYIASVHSGTLCEEHGAAEANAALIVRAVNSHEAIIKALKKSLWAIGRVETLKGRVDDEVEKTLNEIHEAITQAEGK